MDRFIILKIKLSRQKYQPNSNREITQKEHSIIILNIILTIKEIKQEPLMQFKEMNSQIILKISMSNLQMISQEMLRPKPIYRM